MQPGGMPNKPGAIHIMLVTFNISKLLRTTDRRHFPTTIPVARALSAAVYFSFSLIGMVMKIVSALATTLQVLRHFPRVFLTMGT